MIFKISTCFYLQNPKATFQWISLIKMVFNGDQVVNLQIENWARPGEQGKFLKAN